MIQSTTGLLYLIFHIRFYLLQKLKLGSDFVRYWFCQHILDCDHNQVSTQKIAILGKGWGFWCLVQNRILDSSQSCLVQQGSHLKGWTLDTSQLGKLTGCDDNLHGWFGLLEKGFSYKDVQFLELCPPVKNNCPSSKIIREITGTG